ncbi:MAG: type I glyceraldehyde-3-phosphate dehydrogenase [Desulfovibrio sp.]|nr:type I glyceraldehyde-3-phosphate dehydrogenase [Desulfovibrio sp.]
MAVNVGLNGFGRIGRYLLRLMADSQDVRIAAINARASNDQLAYLFKYDSTFGIFPGTVGHDENGIIVNGRHIAVTRCDIGKWEWERLGVTLAVESTGKIKDGEGLSQHLACGAKKAIISAPGKNVDIMVVMGVNDAAYDGSKHNIISAASCTTNCLAPAAKVLHENFGIRHALMTTVHSYTMSQRILDGSDKKDWRRGRAGAVSMVPTSTGAAKAVGQVIPELKGKINGMAVRVPTPDCSLVDLTCEMEKPCTVEQVNAALKAASDGPLKENMGYTTEPLVSVDFVGSTYGGVVDALSTAVMDETMVKVILWYDNEGGFTNQLYRLVKMVAKDC